jgi:hypothetical protein
MLKIPISARIAWNTFTEKAFTRDDQESIFLATFDDIASEKKDKYQIDYSYYNRGKYTDAPKFVLEVYTCGDEAVDALYHFVKKYDGLEEATEDINHWLEIFSNMLTNDALKKDKKTSSKKGKKSAISTISLHLTFRKDTPQYVLDFFTKGVKNEQLPSVLYDYGLKFKNEPNFSGNTTMFCEKKKGRYYLSIYHKFDFNTKATEGYWFVGGLAQYAEDDDLAGYIKHTHEDPINHFFAFRDGLCFWKSDVGIDFTGG